LLSHFSHFGRNLMEEFNAVGVLGGMRRSRTRPHETINQEKP
jgi:hypothetical protein